MRYSEAERLAVRLLLLAVLYYSTGTRLPLLSTSPPEYSQYYEEQLEPGNHNKTCENQLTIQCPG
eukprot:COSAG03_NODE_1658_length_3707_cov_54.710920_2_plen_65_part_00